MKNINGKLVIGGVLGLSPCLVYANNTEKPVKPNIIIIYTDDMGVGDVSFLNDGWVKTPNIDKLASQGLVINNYYTSSPVSSASRAGLITGVFPTELGITCYLDTRQANTNREQFDYLNPDIITMAKALGCGVPVGAFLARGKVANAMVPGDHGTTYGGNPFVTAGVSKVFDLFEDYDIINKVNNTGKYLEEQLDKLVEEYDTIIQRRGMGLMQGIEFTGPVSDIVEKAIVRGLIVITAGANILRFLPPLIITREDIDEMIRILRGILQDR